MNKKTWKRETAFLFGLGLAWVIYTGDTEMAKVIIWPIMLFIGAAFGMEWATKQTNLVSKNPYGVSYQNPYGQDQYVHTAEMRVKPNEDRV